ncbi:hypothetical protein V8G54_003665, partial [Vigna mungo]
MPWNDRVSGETPVVFDSVKIRMANPTKQNLDGDIVNAVFPSGKMKGRKGPRSVCSSPTKSSVRKFSLWRFCRFCHVFLFFVFFYSKLFLSLFFTLGPSLQWRDTLQ